MSSDYPSFPEESARADQAGHNATTEQPPSIKTAVMLMRVGAAISALGIIATLIELGAIKDLVEEDLGTAGSFTQSQVDSVFQTIVVAAIVAGLIGIALWLWMASANGQGKKWARIVATILAVINVLLFLYGVTAGTSPILSLLVAVASVLVGIAAVVLIYRQDATQFYNAQSSG
ncbi:MAG: hypothetical protein M3499_00800 [Actinomycetota bacterium]|nr:hypothetical protein [Actinomycetota bacterium]